MTQHVDLQSFAEYQDCCLRTSKFKDAEYDPRLTDYPANSFRLAVAGLGLSGEIGEVARLLAVYFDDYGYLTASLITDELGDVAYYLAELASACGLTLYENSFLFSLSSDTRSTLAFAEHFTKLTAAVGEANDYFKKYIAHNKPFDSALVQFHLQAALDRLAYLCGLCGTSLKVVVDRNITKLLERHPEGYREEYYTGAV